VVKLVILAGVAWTLQAIMAMFQYRKFQSKFNELAGEYNIGVGYKKNRLGIGVIVIIAADENGTIKKIEFMKGISVFAGFKSLRTYIGENVFSEFDGKDSCNSIFFKAFKEAVENTKKIMGGEQVTASILT